MFPPRAILAAVDFSEPCRVALTCAARLAKQCRAHLHVLHAEDPLLASAAHAKGIDLNAETRAELGAFMLSAFPAGEWTPSHHVVDGAPVEAICHIAERESADLIVVGARGMSGLETAVFGSTTEGVLRKADTSVLVVPQSWTPPRPDLNDLSLDRSGPLRRRARRPAGNDRGGSPRRPADPRARALVVACGDCAEGAHRRREGRDRVRRSSCRDRAGGRAGGRWRGR